MSQYFIYGLADPDTKMIRYVGQTNNMRERLYNHISEARKPGRKNRKNAWVASLLKQGRKPEIIELARCSSREELNEAEIETIALLTECGFDLTNGTGGGNRVTELTNSHKLKLGNSRRGSHHTDETKERMSIIHKKIAVDNPELTATRVANLKSSFEKRKPSKGEKHVYSKLKEKDILIIRDKMMSGASLSSLQKLYPFVSKQTIWRAATGQTWSHVKGETYVPRKREINQIQHPQSVEIKE